MTPLRPALHSPAFLLHTQRLLTPNPAVVPGSIAKSRFL